MKPASKMTSGVALLSALALAGCGSSGTPAAKLAKVSFKSGALSGTALPARYTCDGKNISPPLEWGAVPPGTRQLALFLVGFTPDPAKRGYLLGVDWAVSGVNPALHRLAAGELPRGAHLGAASSGTRGYSVCPKKGTTEHYRFELFGLSAAAKIPAKFAGFPVMLTLARSKGVGLVAAHGGFATVYKRS